MEIMTLAFLSAVPASLQLSHLASRTCAPRRAKTTVFRVSLGKNGAPAVRCCVESPSPHRNMGSSADKKGEVLVRAAMIGDSMLTKRMLSEGVSANYASIQGQSLMTALMWASAEGHVEIAEELINAGADVNARNAQGATALLFAVENVPTANPREAPPPGFPGRRGNDDKKPKPKQVPIVARVTGHLDIIRKLIAHGADISVRNSFDETLLHMAARKAQDGLVREFLVRGIEINAKSRGFQETALHIAAKEDHAPVVKQLCDLGANVEARSRFGWTPLLWAAASGWESVVEVLIEEGANVNAKAGEGAYKTTPLKEARRSSRPQSVSKLLIRAGAVE